MSQPKEDLPSKRSCLRCHEHKVRCDRENPCGRCLQVGAKCSFPVNKRAPRKLNRPPIATILGQKRQLEEEVERLRATSTGQHPFSSAGILGLGLESGTEVVDSYKLKSPQIKALWDIYKKNVAPMIALLHKQSIEATFYDACTKPEPNLSPASEVLVQAICFSAVVGATQEQCLSIFSQPREWCIQRTRSAVEQGLSRANLITTQDIHVLQAAVLFLLCLRWLDSRLAWAQSAIVVRVAQGQGVHRDGQASGLSPFNIEMRRRLWWHICILDVLCSEDQGTDTQIRPGMFDTKIPTNIDIDDLSADLTTLPPARRGFTDITLCIMHSEILSNLDWASLNLNLGTTQHPMSEPETVLCSLATRLEEEYLQVFDLGVPIQWLTAVIVRLCLSKARVVNLLNKSRMNKVPITSNDEIFDVAVEMIKFAKLIQDNEATAQWSWLCKSYKQRHAVSFILSELCVRPITPETNQAWEIVTEMYKQWQQEDNDKGAEMPAELSNLMKQAASVRNQKLESLSVPHIHSTSLPIPRSIVREKFPNPAPTIGWSAGPSIANDPVGIDHILEQGSPLSLSSMDWLTGPWL